MTSALTMGAVPTSQDPLEAWLVSARAGDREALEYFLEAIAERVYTLAWRLLGDAARAEDASQEALLKISRSLDHYRSGTNLWGWIYRIVVNQAHDARRSQAARRETDVSSAQEPAALRRYDPERHEQLRRVIEAMAVLSAKEREALVMIDMEGLTSREAAAALGCLAITARTRAAHARKKVRRELSRYYPELQESS